MDEETIFKALTLKGSTRLESLDDLSQVGKNFLYACVHLLEKPKGEIHQHKNTFNTFKILESKNISVDRNEVLNFLSNFVDTEGCLINNKNKRVLSMITNHIESNLNVQKDKKPIVEGKEDWLTAYKSQCKLGQHNSVEMANLLGMKVDTFRSKILREKKSKVIEIAYNGPLSCEFCLKKQQKEAENKGSDPFVTPKRKSTRNESSQKNKKPRVEEVDWLTAYKSQCKLGQHKIIEMANLIGMNIETFRSKILRERKSKDIEIAYNGPLSCEFCLKIKVQEAEHRESDLFVTPKGNVSINKVTPSSSPSNNQITEEMLAKVATKCSKHTHLNMADFFGVKRTALTRRINRSNLVFSNTEEDPLICHFCPSVDSPTIESPSNTSKIITEEMMNIIKTKCADNHDWTEVANYFGVSPSTLRYHMNKLEKSGFIYSNIYNDSSKCFFCVDTPLPDRSDAVLKRLMDPIIESVKKLSGIERKTEEYILCQVAKRMCNQSGNRRLAQIFEKLGEDPESEFTKVKFKVPVKQTSHMKVKLMLSVNSYNDLRGLLSEYITFPCIDTIVQAQKPMYPTEEEPEDFIMDGKAVGKFWPPLKLLQNSVVDILEVFHGENPKRVPNEMTLKGSFGGDGASGFTDRMGGDKDLDTGSRYVLGAKIDQLIVEPEKIGGEVIEYFLETSQSHVTFKPILIAQFKENSETLGITWEWIQKKWKNELQSFTVRFDKRDIRINFPKPKITGDGKLFLQLLNLPQAYCYLCTITRDMGQDTEECKHGMKIDRDLDSMYDLMEKYTKLWEKAKRNKKTKKKFLNYFTAEERQFMCGFAKVMRGGFDFRNLPTMHFKIHLFDFAKKINYQMGSRQYTTSQESVAEIEKKLGNSKRKTVVRVKKQPCQNPICDEKPKGFVKLKQHVIGKKQPKRCIQYYGKNNLLPDLISNAKNELTFKRRTKKKSTNQNHLERAKKDFTKKIFDSLGIKVNKMKLAGRGANSENGNTTMEFLKSKNRPKVLSLYHTKSDKEIADLDLFFDQARVIIGVTNKIGKINCQAFSEYVKDAYLHWINSFKQFAHIKSSLHWTLGHVCTLIASNRGYTLAGVSENSVEKWIKPYRVVTLTNARQTKMQDNNTDCLRIMYLQTRQDIRKFDRIMKTTEPDDDVSRKIDSFFIKNEDGKVWSFKEKSNLHD